jgi:YVTN family beta-propeller protein
VKPSQLLLLILLFSLGSCRKDIGKYNYGNYPQGIGTIINSNCSVEGCHNSLSYLAAGGLNLESWSAMFAGAYNGSPVIPYSSRFSFLCYYINTYSELGPVNKPTMPLNGTPLKKEEVSSIMNWINDGAPDINGKVMWADNARRKKLYVVNQGCDVVTVLDAETQLPIRYIDVGNKPGGSDTPHHVRVSHDGRYWYVIFINNNIMQKFRCDDDSYVGDIPLTPFAAGTSTDPADNAFDWNTFVISSDSKRAYCVSWNGGKISAVDLENRKLLHYLPGLNLPHGIALNGSNDKVYITAQTGNYVSVLDSGFTESPVRISLENGKIPTSASSLNIHDIVFSPSGSNFLVTCQQTNEVRVYDLQKQEVTAVISTGVYPQEIIYSPAYKSYFVSCMNDSTTFPGSYGLITKINEVGFSTAMLPCGFQPHGIAVDDHKGLLYVVSRNVASGGPPPHHTSICNGRNGFVSFIDLSNFKLLKKRYELSVDPYFIYYRP